jgi:hypothetical protein
MSTIVWQSREVFLISQALLKSCNLSKYCFPHPSGLAGLLPQHPRTYMTAWRNREELEQQKLLKEVEAQEENS